MPLLDVESIMRQLVGFQSVTANQKECLKLLQFVESLFSDLEVEVKYFEHNGVHSQLIVPKGTAWQTPTILLNGHIDVVPATDEQFAVRREGDKAFGRGTADMKGAAAAAIVAFAHTLGTNPSLNCGLFLTGDEEIGGTNGTGYVVNECGLRPGFVIVVDGCDKESNIKTKSKGGLWLELYASGKSAHAAHPWLGENALDKLIGAISKIKALVGPMVPEAWESTVNLARIETDNATPNIVPKEAKALLDIRFTEALAATPEELYEKIEGLVPECEVKQLSSVAMSYISEDHPLIMKYAETASQVIGNSILFAFSHGATDGRYFAAQNIPTIVTGPIGDDMHGAAEWVSISSLEQFRGILENFLKEAAVSR